MGGGIEIEIINCRTQDLKDFKQRNIRWILDSATAQKMCKEGKYSTHLYLQDNLWYFGYQIKKAIFKYPRDYNRAYITKADIIHHTGNTVSIIFMNIQKNVYPW